MKLNKYFDGCSRHLLPAFVVVLIVGLAVTPTLQAADVDLLTIVNIDDYSDQIPSIKKGKKEVTEGKAPKQNIGSIDLSKCADGTYIGTGTGYAGYIKVKVTLKNHEMTSIKIIENEADDAPYMAKAEKVVNSVLKAQALDVDTVSGATYSSNGILAAIEDALKQAAGEDAAKTSNNKKKKQKKDTSMDGKKFKDGTYSGKGMGYVDEIHVNVTIKASKIKTIKVTKHREDQPYMKNAMALIKSIVKAQSINVDTVTGATFSSKGIIEAVKDALKKAVIVNDPSLDNPKDDSIDDDYKPTYGQYIDGLYKGMAKGYKSTFVATVVIESGNIYSINIKQDDDEAYYRQCTHIIQSIINRQTTDGIDTVSGCTLSSNGILNSVNNALFKAKKPEMPESIKEDDEN